MKNIVLMLTLMLINSCSTIRKMTNGGNIVNYVDIGASKKSVIDEYGNAKNVLRVGDLEYLKYGNGILVFKDDKVVRRRSGEKRKVRVTVSTLSIEKPDKKKDFFILPGKDRSPSSIKYRTVNKLTYASLIANGYAVVSKSDKKAVPRSLAELQFLEETNSQEIKKSKAMYNYKPAESYTVSDQYGNRLNVKSNNYGSTEYAGQRSWTETHHFTTTAITLNGLNTSELYESKKRQVDWRLSMINVSEGNNLLDDTPYLLTGGLSVIEKDKNSKKSEILVEGSNFKLLVALDLAEYYL